MTTAQAIALVNQDPRFEQLLEEYGALLTVQLLGAALLKHANAQEGPLLQQLALQTASHVLTAANAIEADAN